MTETPPFGVVTQGTLYSKASTRGPIIEDYLTILDLMLEQHIKGETENYSILIQINATNGYMIMGWSNYTRSETGETDFGWESSPYYVHFPVLFDKGDSLYFEQRLWSAARALVRMFWAHYRNNRKNAEVAALPMDKLTKKPSQTSFNVPTEKVFTMSIANDVDYVPRWVRN